MKLGPLHIEWRTSAKRQDDHNAVIVFLATHPEARAIVSRMARSECKNILAEWAEKAGVPFGDPIAFVRAMSTAAEPDALPAEHEEAA